MSLYISRTPFRISFFGGGTDYPAWYRREGGAVLSTTIDKYCYITARYLPPFFPTTYRIVWSHIETVTSIAEILHPAVREGLRMFGYSDSKGVEIHHQGDLPARTGMGTSSAFAVGLVNVLAALKGEPSNKQALYLRALELEQEWLKDPVGSQDQVATAAGGFNLIGFAPSGAITVEPVAASPGRIAELDCNLMMFYTGSSRLSAGITSKVIASLELQAEVLREMHGLVHEAVGLMQSDADLDEFGRLLDHTWRLKRSLTDGISNGTIDEIYARALNTGALGGKLLGGGGSGFMLFYVPQERQEAVRQALEPLLHVPFRFESKGSILLGNGDE